MARSLHRGTVSHLAPFIPGQTSKGLKCCGGLPYAINIDNGEPELIDPYRWKQHGHIGAPIALTLAQINGGKTSLAKKLGDLLSQLKASNGHRVRVALDDHRRNSGELEYRKFVEFLGSREHSLSSMPINILDPRMNMTRAQNLRMLIDVAQYVSNTKLSPEQVMSLQIALNMMCDIHPESTTLELLIVFLRIQTTEDIETYLNRHTKNVMSQLRVTPSEIAIYGSADSTWKVDLHARLRNTHRVEAEQLRNAALQLVFIFQRLLPGGDFGGTFGGNHSLVDVMSQQVFAADYTGLEPAAVGLVQSLMWRWKGSAHERADTSLAFQLEIHDENHKLWKNIEYARAMSAYMKLIRSTSAFLILNSHRSGDYEAIAGEEGLLAQNALDEVEILFLGGQPPKVAREIGKRFDLSRTVTNRLPDLSTGQFCLVLKNRAPVFLQLILTPRDLVVCESNQANNKMLED